MSAVLARYLDDKLNTLRQAGALNAMWFSWRGQELLGATIGTSLRHDDYLVPYYRDGGAQLAKGSSLRKMWAEAMGKSTGGQKGKSGWAHMIDPSANVVMNSAVVGAQLPIAAGFALASQLREDGKVTVCTFGDGAACEGAFHEALGLAAIWRLPVVYVCHNNLYAEHTAFRKTSPVEHLSDRAKGYGIPGVTVDGDDVVATWNVLQEAIDRARAGDGPSLVEGICYRYRGHGPFDKMSYVPDGELESKIALDGLPRFRRWLIDQGQASEEELAVIDGIASREVDEAWEFANSSPYPDMTELFTDVYAEA